MLLALITATHKLIKRILTMKQSLINHPQRTALYGAILIIAPLALIIYENLASHNGHPSVINAISEIITNNNPEKQEDIPLTETKKIVKKSLKKINIKASNPETTTAKTKDDKRFVSLQKKPPSAVQKVLDKTENKALSVGNNIKGSVDLPNLILEGELSEEVLGLLLKHAQAYIIVNQTHYYDIKKNDSLWGGSFNILQDSDIEMLSNRNFNLPTELSSKLDTRYQLAMLGVAHESKYSLRFTRKVNHHLVKVQLSAQEKASSLLEETTFIMAIENGHVTFTLI